MARFTWLHLTDLHVGQGESYRWPNRREDALEDIERLHGQLGRVDAILFTGDLTQRGSKSEFDTFSEEMAHVSSLLGRLGSRPILLAVPGNHDLIRPPNLDPRRRIWRVPDAFWTDRNHEVRSVVSGAFANWSRWAGDGLTWRDPRLTEVHREGLLPGDFLATWALDDLRVGIAGLNTAALQLGPGDYEGRLAVDLRQLTVLEPEIGRWAQSHDACLLLTHHPVTWLSKASRREFHAEIYPPERFAIHLCGHNHLPEQSVVSLGGGDARRTVIGRSLYGLEHFAGRTDRIYGYSAGWIQVESHRRTWVAWPRSANLKQDGSLRFGLDPSTITEPGTEHTSPVSLGPPPRVRAMSWGTPPDPDLLRQVAALLERDYRKRSARKGLLDEAQVQADPSEPWSEILARLSESAVRSLLEHSDSDGAPALIVRLGVRPPADPGILDVLVEDRFAAAARLFSDEAYQEAAVEYASIAERVEALGGAGAKSVARALLNRAAALHSFGDVEGFTALIRSDVIDRAVLAPRGRINLARLQIADGDPEGALRSVEGLDEPGVRVIRQLVDLVRGQPPAEPVEDIDVLLQTAIHQVEHRRCQKAVELAVRASRLDGVNEWGRNRAAEVVGRALAHHWMGASDEEIVAPRDALEQLERLAATPRARCDWTTVDAALEFCNEESMPSELQQTPMVELPTAVARWSRDLEEASRGGAASIRAVALQWPQVGPLQVAAAHQLLAYGEIEHAVNCARRAFALLPGRGQRSLLATTMLSASGDHASELALHLEVLRALPARSDDIWQVLVQGAIYVDDLREAANLVTEWARVSSTPAAFVWDVVVRLRRGEVAEARYAAHRALAAEGLLPLEVIRTLAAAAVSVP
ncbi:MAG: metallophosphoesterase, partial [Myxococcota bacterium]